MISQKKFLQKMSHVLVNKTLHNYMKNDIQKYLKMNIYAKSIKNERVFKT